MTDKLSHGSRRSWPEDLPTTIVVEGTALPASAARRRFAITPSSEGKTQKAVAHLMSVT